MSKAKPDTAPDAPPAPAAEPTNALVASKPLDDKPVEAHGLVVAPSLGRIILVRPRNHQQGHDEFPAIVTRAMNELVSVTMFPPYNAPKAIMTPVPHESCPGPRSTYVWRWPPKA